MSNQSRDLERHVNPADPTGKLLDHLPDLQDRLEAQLKTAETKARKPRKRTSKRTKKASTKRLTNAPPKRS